MIVACNFFYAVFNLRLPDQPLMQLEPPTKKSKFSKSRVATTGKGVAKQSKNSNHVSQSADAASSSGNSSNASSNAGSKVCGTASTSNNSGVGHKHKRAVEKVIVEQPVCHGDMRGQYVPEWDPYVMVETVSNVRLFPGNPMLDSEIYMAPVGVSGMRMTNMTSLPIYGDAHTSLIKGESSQKAKGYSKKIGTSYSLSSKEKGPQKAKMVIHKGKKNAQKNKADQVLLSDASSTRSDKGYASHQTKSLSNKQLLLAAAVPSSGPDESFKQRGHHGESSRPHSSHKAWPTIPNLDYASGKRFQVTYNNETVFITQYKLLK